MSLVHALYLGLGARGSVPRERSKCFFTHVCDDTYRPKAILCVLDPSKSEVPREGVPFYKTLLNRLSAGPPHEAIGILSFSRYCL